jgi:hypothetical protein
MGKQTKEAKMANAILIPADPGKPIRTIQVGDLADLQRAVAGHIEAHVWKHDRPDVTCYLNDEGKFDGLPRNDRATSLLGTVLFVGDWIAGNLLITGTDSQGELKDCPITTDELRPLVGVSTYA